MLERFHPARLFVVSVTDNTRSDRSRSQDSSGVTERGESWSKVRSMRVVGLLRLGRATHTPQLHRVLFLRRAMGAQMWGSSTVDLVATAVAPSFGGRAWQHHPRRLNFSLLSTASTRCMLQRLLRSSSLPHFICWRFCEAETYSRLNRVRNGT